MILGVLLNERNFFTPGEIILFQRRNFFPKVKATPIGLQAWTGP
jgi:hypothetical protein